MSDVLTLVDHSSAEGNSRTGRYCLGAGFDSSSSSSAGPTLQRLGLNDF